MNPPPFPPLSQTNVVQGEILISNAPENNMEEYESNGDLDYEYTEIAAEKPIEECEVYTLEYYRDLFASYKTAINSLIYKLQTSMKYYQTSFTSDKLYDLQSQFNLAFYQIKPLITQNEQTSNVFLDIQDSIILFRTCIDDYDFCFPKTPPSPIERYYATERYKQHYCQRIDSLCTSLNNSFLKTIEDECKSNNFIVSPSWREFMKKIVFCINSSI